MGRRGPLEVVFVMGGSAHRGSGARRRRTSGSALAAAVIGVALSAAAVSGAYVVLKSAPSDDSLRIRVDLQLESARVLRDIAGLLKDSTPVESSDSVVGFAFRRAGVSRAIVLEGGELKLRSIDRLEARVLGRGVEGVEFERAAPNRLRVTAEFRRVVEKKAYSVRQSITVDLGAAEPGQRKAPAGSCVLD